MTGSTGHMAKLIYEMWLDPNEYGEPLPSLCLAGPEGEGFRKLLHPGAILRGTLLAESTFDAMTQYYQRNGWGEWTTQFAADYEIHAQEQADAQQAHLQPRD
jgi:hypothetical protein